MNALTKLLKGAVPPSSDIEAQIEKCQSDVAQLKEELSGAESEYDDVLIESGVAAAEKLSVNIRRIRNEIHRLELLEHRLSERFAEACENEKLERDRELHDHANMLCDQAAKELSEYRRHADAIREIMISLAAKDRVVDQINNALRENGRRDLVVPKINKRYRTGDSSLSYAPLPDHVYLPPSDGGSNCPWFPMRDPARSNVVPMAAQNEEIMATAEKLSPAQLKFDE